MMDGTYSSPFAQDPLDGGCHVQIAYPGQYIRQSGSTRCARTGAWSRLRAMQHHRRLLHAMHRLALMGALLMALAPVVSRWMQMHPAGAAAQLMALCTTGGLRLVEHHRSSAALPPPAYDTITSVDTTADDGTRMPLDQHAGMACDYCTLAARLLPFVVALLLLPLIPLSRSPRINDNVRPRATLAWPAHAARGPPAYLVA